MGAVVLADCDSAAAPDVRGCAGGHFPLSFYNLQYNFHYPVQKKQPHPRIAHHNGKTLSARQHHFSRFQMHLFYASTIGMFLAFIYVKTGKLRYTILMHMVINFFGTWERRKTATAYRDSAKTPDLSCK